METERNEKPAGSRKAIKPTPWAEPVAPLEKTVTFKERKAAKKPASAEQKG